MPSASVIVPTLEGGANLEKCLAALQAQTFSDFATVVVDNSGGGIAEGPARAAGALWIRNAANAGFGGAVNQGMDAAPAEFFCALNDDAFPEPRWLEELVAACRSDAQVGMCASQIRLADFPDRLDSAGMEIYLDGSSKQRGRMAPASKFPKQEEVLFPSACAALYRASMLEQIGRFDADFFLYCEDTDLGLRGRRAGWRSIYVPGAVVYHQYSGSAGRASAKKAFYVERNRLYTVIKNFPVWTWPLMPLFSLYRYAMHVWGLVQGRGLASEASLSGWQLAGVALSANLEAWKNLFDLLRKRRLVARASAMPAGAFWRLLRKHAISARDLALQP